MPPQVRRAIQLRELRRFAEAEAMFREALADAPDDADTLHELAICQYCQPEGETRALATINSALASQPNESRHHALRGLILAAMDRGDEALAAAREAVRLDPTSDVAYVAEAHAHLRRQNWTQMERAARQALSLDADNSDAATLLAHSLGLQGKRADNAAQIAGMLARDPANSHVQAAAGWSALQHGDQRGAQTHFLEALRLNPESDMARTGLVESFKARSPFYRAYLAWCFWMTKHSKERRWAIVIGLYLMAKVSGRLIHTAAGPAAIVFLALYLAFVLWVHVASGVGNFMVLLDRFARHALTRPERWEAVCVGGAVCASLVLGVATFVLHSFPLGVTAVTLLAASFPFAYTFTNKAPVGRWLFGGVAALVLIAGGVMLSTFVTPLFDEIAEPLAGAAGFGVLATTWLSNVRALHR